MRRVLFDENAPVRLRRELSEFEIRTVQEERWAGTRNGDLIRRAQETFDVLLTVDRRLRHQQNITSFTIGVVVLEQPRTRYEDLRPFARDISAAIAGVKAGEVRIVRCEP